MPEKTGRPRVTVRFRFNVASGEVEEFLIDDHAPDRSEDYHDRVARAIAGLLVREPEIGDAGPRHELARERPLPAAGAGQAAEEPESGTRANQG